MNKREFELACSVLPPDFCWGEPVTPELVLHIIGAATPSAQSSQQGAVAWLVTHPHSGTSAWSTEASARNYAEERGLSVQPLYTHPHATESDRRDAERYRWLVKNCFDWAAPGEGDSFDHIELHFESDMLNRNDESVGRAIDAEIIRALSQTPAPGGE